MQNGWEKMLSIAAAILGRNDLMINSGMYGTGMTVGLEQLVLDHEMYKIASRFAQGMEVSEEKLAVDLICGVGSQGEYLSEAHTVDLLRTGEHTEPGIIRLEMAKAEAERILGFPTEKRLSKSEESYINNRIGKYEKEHG
jgi:trimethylamine:corrinoid methyltransferase-like protein